jgi:hypothetical protein
MRWIFASVLTLFLLLLPFGFGQMATAPGYTPVRVLQSSTPASDLICAHAGDTSISAESGTLTCGNGADATTDTEFATTWTIPATGAWAAGRCYRFSGAFQIWTTATAPQLKDFALVAAVGQIVTMTSAFAPQASLTGAGFGAIWGVTSFDATPSVVLGQALAGPSIPGASFQNTGNSQGAATSGFGSWSTIGVHFKYNTMTGVKSGTYTSGGSIAGSTSQTCTLGTFNNGNTGATATVALTGTNTIAGGTALTITNTGYGSTSAATSATLGNGTATCSGTATIATVLGGAQGNGIRLQNLIVEQIY